MQGKLREKLFLCLSCTHCLGRQGFFHLLRQIHFHPSCTPAGWPGRTASVGSCWVPSMEGTGRKRVTERSGYSLPQTLLSWPSFSTEVKLLSDGSFATLRLWLNSSQFDWIRACPFKLRGSNGHSPSSSLWCFTIPPDSLLLAMPPQRVPLLIFFNDHLECTLFCGDPSTMLHYQEWIKRIWISIQILCHVHMFLALYATRYHPERCLSGRLWASHTYLPAQTQFQAVSISQQAGGAWQDCEYLH